MHFGSARIGRGRALSGQALVECAIALPVLFGLLLMTVNLSMMFRGFMIAQQAASEAARYSATYESRAHDTTTSAPTASEVKAYAKAAVGITGMDVQVSSVYVSDPTYTMRVTGVDGVTRSSAAKTVRRGTRVTVKIPVTLVGMSEPFWATASHTGISSTEGQAV